MSITLSQVSSGGASIQDITHAALLTAMDSSTLTAGQQYRITDYASKNFLFGNFYSTQNPAKRTFINTGTVEPLIVTAISTSNISQVAYSETYPDDIIYYDPLVKTLAITESLTGALTFVSGKWRLEIANNVGLGNVTQIYIGFNGGADFIIGNIGHLKYGTNMNFDFIEPYSTASSTVSVSAGVGTTIFEFDNLTNGAWVADGGIGYANMPTKYDDATGLINRRINTTVNVSVPVDFRGYKYRRYEMDIESARTGLTTNYYGIDSSITLPDGTIVNTTGNFYDMYIFNSQAGTTNNSPYPVGLNIADGTTSIPFGYIEDVNITHSLDNAVFLQSANNKFSVRTVWNCTLSGSGDCDNIRDSVINSVNRCYYINNSFGNYYTSNKGVESCICANISENDNLTITTVMSDDANLFVQGNSGSGIINNCKLESGSINGNYIKGSLDGYNVKDGTGTLAGFGFVSNCINSYSLTGDNSNTIGSYLDIQGVHGCTWDDGASDSANFTKYLDIRGITFKGKISGTSVGVPRVVNSATVGNAFLLNFAGKIIYATGANAADPLVYNYYNTLGVLQSGIVA